MTDAGKTRAQQLLGDTAPDLVRLTDDVLFGEVWADPGLSPRDRSLVTVAALVSLYRTDAGWPCAMSAMSQLKQVTEG